VYPLRRIWTPALYQGGSRSRRYFEGWYFKLVDAGGEHALAIIPGVSFSADGATSHAFVQLIESGGRTRYFAYPSSAFSFDQREFAVRIAGNSFSRNGVTLDLADEYGVVTGSIGFGPWSPWPVTLLSPGIMGPFRFVPGMETYHGVLSMDHSISGGITLGDRRLDFDGGRGYIEKDWGRSFPSSWVWAQSNRFERVGVSVTASVARIPWMTGAFVGHIAGMLLDGELHRFTTYTGARLQSVETRSDGADIVIRDRHRELELHLSGVSPGALKSPTLGSMEGRTDESLDGTIHTTLRAVRGGRANVLFEGTGRTAGIEIMNEAGELGQAR
jgi:tocopherol cyclase